MKNRLNIFIKIFLFLTAYYPLFLILFVQNSNLIDKIFKEGISSIKWMNFNDSLIYGLIIGLIFFILLKIFIKFQSKSNTYQFRVIKIKDVSHETLNYILTYLIAFLSLKLNDPKDIISILILLFIIGIIYVNSNLLYINPFLQLLNYSIYELTIKKDMAEKSIVIIAILPNNKIIKNEYINISLVNEGFKNIYFIK